MILLSLDWCLLKGMKCLNVIWPIKLFMSLTLKRLRFDWPDSLSIERKCAKWYVDSQWSVKWDRLQWVAMWKQGLHCLPYRSHLPIGWSHGSVRWICECCVPPPHPGKLWLRSSTHSVWLLCPWHPSCVGLSGEVWTGIGDASTHCFHIDSPYCFSSPVSINHAISGHYCRIQTQTFSSCSKFKSELLPCTQINSFFVSPFKGHILSAPVWVCSIVDMSDRVNVRPMSAPTTGLMQRLAID